MCFPFSPITLQNHSHSRSGTGSQSSLPQRPTRSSAGSAGGAKDRTQASSRPTQVGTRDPSRSHSATGVKGKPRNTTQEGNHVQTATQSSGQALSGRGRESNHPIQGSNHSKYSVQGHGQSRLNPVAGTGNPIQESQARASTRSSSRSHSGTGGERKVRSPTQEGTQASQPGIEPVAVQRISGEPVRSTGQQIDEQASGTTATVSFDHY